MQNIDRNIFIITPTEACIEWANSLDDQVIIDMEEIKGHDAASVFLIPRFECAEDAIEWMKESASDWFATLLMEWSEDEEQWPPDLSWEKLNEFYEIKFQSLIMDVLDAPIEKLGGWIDDEGDLDINLN